MTDIIELIDWIVKKAIVGIRLSIILMILDFIYMILVQYGIVEPFLTNHK
jgi:hypothetical protein